MGECKDGLASRVDQRCYDIKRKNRMSERPKNAPEYVTAGSSDQQTPTPRRIPRLVIDGRRSRVGGIPRLVIGEKKPLPAPSPDVPRLVIGNEDTNLPPDAPHPKLPMLVIAGRSERPCHVGGCTAKHGVSHAHYPLTAGQQHSVTDSARPDASTFKDAPGRTDERTS